MATWNTTRLMGASGNRTARIVTCAKGYGFHSADILNPPANVPRLASTADNSGLRGQRVSRGFFLLRKTVQAVVYSEILTEIRDSAQKVCRGLCISAMT